MTKKIVLSLILLCFFSLLVVGAFIGLRELNKDSSNKEVSLESLTYSIDNGTVSPEYYKKTEYRIDGSTLSAEVTFGYAFDSQNHRVENLGEYKMTLEQKAELEKIIEELDIQEIKAKNECVGGSTINLQIKAEGYEIEGYYSECGDGVDGTLDKDPSKIEDFFIDNFEF